MTNLNADTAASLRVWVIENLFDGHAPPGFDDDSDLIADGVMDSLAIMRTLSHLEQDHGIAVDPGDIVPQHFSSIRALARLVAAKGQRGFA